MITLRSLLLLFISINIQIAGQSLATKAPATTAPASTTSPASTAKTGPTLDQTIKSQSAANASDTAKLNEVAQQYIFAAWPELPGLMGQASTAQTQPPLYPTTSINESAVDSFYGAQGLNVDSVLLSYIKAFYFYFEYCVRRERAAQLITLAIQNSVDYDTILTTGRWSDLITALSTKGAINYASITPTQEAWGSVNGTFSDTFTSEKKDLTQFWTQITTTSFWSDLALTNTDLQASIFWQDFAKVMITKTYELDNGLLQGRVTNEQQLFRYLPYLETAYYLPDYTEQRYTAELIQLGLVLNEHVRDRFLAQSQDWGALKNATTNQFNYSQILTSAACFQASHFYQILKNFSVPSCNAQGQSSTGFLPCDPTCDPFCSPTNPEVSCADIPFVQQSDGSFSLQQVTLNEPYKHEFIFLSMAVTLQTLLYSLFQGKALATTCSFLAKNPTGPTLSVLPYNIDDAVYLEDWAGLTTLIPAAAEQNAANNTSKQQFAAGASSSLATRPASTTTPTTSTDNEGVTPQSWGDFVNWVKSTGQAIGSEIESVGKDIVATAKDIGEIVENEAQVLYYQTGLATLITGLPEAQAQQLAASYQDALNGDFQSFQTDVTGLVTNLVQLAETPEKVIAGGVLAGIGAILNDPSLAADYDQMLDTVADAIGTYVGAEVAISARLSVDAVALLTTAIVSVGAGPQAFMDSWKGLANDLVSSILESITIAVDAVKDVIADVIKSVGYLIKLITDAIIDTGAACEAIFDAVRYDNLANIGNYYAQASADLNTHRNFISQLVTVGLLVVTTVVLTVATGGAFLGVGFALSMGATLAFGGLMCASGWQEDEEVGDICSEISAYLSAFSIWANNQVVVVQAMQNMLVSEISEELNAALSNAELGLGFYENFFNNALNSYKSQAGYQLGAWVSALLKPDPQWQPVVSTSSILLGDVGHTFGYSTGWLNLNPSQGFAAYEPSRSHFVQEIAQMPATFTDPSTNQQTSLFWFLQSISKDVQQSPTSQVLFEVRLRPLYLLNQFYIGIGIGGVPIDITNLQSTQQANIDRYNLAKMIVFKKETSSSPVTLGVYEHETTIASAQNGWLSSTTAPAFNVGSWYHIRGTLNGSTLQVQAWQEGSTTPGTTSVTVTPLPTTAYEPDGVTQFNVTAVPLTVIFSGGSVEFDIITPSQSGAIATACDSNNHCVYPSPKNANYQSSSGPAQTEKEREQAASHIYHQAHDPVFGAFTDLAAVSHYEILRGHYVYTTGKTTIAADTNGALKTDYVVFGTINTQSPQQPATSIGTSLANLPAPNSLISLLSGKIYDNTAKAIGNQGGVWAALQAANTQVGSPLSQAIVTPVTTAQKTLVTAIMKPYTLGSNVTLTPANSTDFAQGNYVYTTTIAGQTDYVLLANIDPTANTAVAVNLLPSQLDETDYVPGMVSLTTMSIYSSKSCTATSCPPVRCLTPTAYASFVSLLSTTLQASIKAVQQKISSCQNQQKPPATQSQPPSTQQTNPSSVDTTQGQQTQSSTVPTIGSGSTSSISQQQEEASAGNSF